MPDWQLCTMRFFCYQEEQASSSLDFPEWLHQCLSEKLHLSQGYSVLGLLLENNNCDSNERSLWRSCVIYTFSVKKNPGSRNPSCAAVWGDTGGGDTPITTSQVLGRVQVRVGRKDPTLFRMLHTEFFFLEQIHSFWMRFTKQNASGWVPTQNKFCN